MGETEKQNAKESASVSTDVKEMKEAAEEAKASTTADTADAITNGETKEGDAKAEDAAEKTADKLEMEGDDMIKKLADAGVTPPKTPTTKVEEKTEEQKEQQEKKREEK